jgi:hypothetical protein
MSTTIFVIYIEQQLSLWMDKRYKHVYMEDDYTNYRIKFIYSSLNINYENVWERGAVQIAFPKKLIFFVLQKINFFLYFLDRFDALISKMIFLKK